MSEYLSDNILRDCDGDIPFDMGQYKAVLGATRIPCCPLDYVIGVPEGDHILVMYRNQFFRLTVKEDRRWLTQHSILQQLIDIVQERCTGKPVGLLTADCRDNWNLAYDQLRNNKKNKDSVEEIEEALFLLCLDTVTPPDSLTKATAALKQCLHGGGPEVNGANRWFDKTIQFVVGKYGISGVCFGTSLAEPDIITGIMNFIYSRMDKNEDTVPTCLKPKKLKFELDTCDVESISCAETLFICSVCDLELFCFKFTGYGKKTLKSLLLNPDSFIQMAVQTTNFKITGELAPQMQRVSTRKFLEGRSDEVRISTIETMKMVCALCDPVISTGDKRKVLALAIKAHHTRVDQTMNGEGIERHLYGLKMIAEECSLPEPCIFSLPLYTKSSCLKIYTAEMNSNFDGFMGASPKTCNGYSIFYNIRDDHINFSISASASSPETDVRLFADTLTTILKQLRDIAT